MTSQKVRAPQVYARIGGVVYLIIIIAGTTIERETIKVKEMFCSFQWLNNGWVPAMAKCAARSDSAAF
jgi:hypothetical protein